MKAYISKSLDDLNEIARSLIEDFEKNTVIVFLGEMGVGKTTLIKSICAFLGVDDTTSSPTFSIVNEYLSKENKVIYHFDFYRINDEEEVMDLGYEDYFYSKNYCFIEWPEKIPTLLPHNVVKVYLEEDEDGSRLISL